MPRAQEVIDAAGTVVRRKPAIGDVRWDGKAWKRWTGRRWVLAAYSLRPERLEDAAPLHNDPPVSQERRQRALTLAVEDQVTSNGATVILDGPHGVVLAYRQPVSHLFHAVMTLLTAGLWAVVWLAIALSGRENRALLEADAWGNVWARSVASA